jgi:hypothetical protein
MPRIFISYRRDDTSGYAGRLRDQLASRLRRWDIFMDVDAIAPGADFVRVISDAVAASDVVVAVVGRNWARNADSAAAVSRPDDFVRIEIELALQHRKPIIPTLVGGAVMPSRDTLPVSMQPFVQRQAFPIDDRDFHGGISRLVQAVRELSASSRRPVASGDTSFHSRGLLVPVLAVFHLLATWPVLMVPENPGSLLVALATWMTGPVLGELSRRWNVRVGMALGFLFPYLPFWFASKGGLETTPDWYRLVFATVTSVLALWTIYTWRGSRGQPIEAPLPLAAVIPFTLGLAIAIQLLLSR